MLKISRAPPWRSVRAVWLDEKMRIPQQAAKHFDIVAALRQASALKPARKRAPPAGA